MLFRQLFDRETCTFTYLLADPQLRKAVIIDPVVELVDRDSQFIHELGLDLVLAIDTHVHADHITGAGKLHERFGCHTVVSEAAGATAHKRVADGDTLEFGRQALEVRLTPGHTAGCMSLVTHDRSRVFTGDALFVRGCGRTDFQGGSAASLYHSVVDRLFSLPEETFVYPAHDYRGRTVSTIGEEKRCNPRLAGRSEAEFVAIMDGLDLANPARIHEAVPANLRGGYAEGVVPQPAPQDAGWAPVVRTATGVPEVSSRWLAEHAGSLRVVDVREAHELTGPLGTIGGSEHVPMGLFPSVAESWSRAEPVVLVCRSGGRSGTVALQLCERGFERVASLRGGMTAWSNNTGQPDA